MRAETRPDRAAVVGALLRVVLAGACWAMAAVLAKYAFERGVPPVRLAEARVAVALVALAPFLAWRRPGLLRPPPGTWPALAGFGACVAAVNLTYYLAIDHLPVGVAVALQYTGPAILLATTTLLLRREPRQPGVRGARLAPVDGSPGRLAWAAAGLSLAGAVLVSRALEGLGALDLPGLAAGLASAVLFAAYLLSAELAGRRGAEPATTLLWGFLVAVAIWSLAVPWWSWPLAFLADPGVAGAVLGVGLLGTLLPFALAVGAVRVISAATAGIAATAEPVFAAAFAWLLLGQRLNPAQLGRGRPGRRRGRPGPAGRGQGPAGGRLAQLRQDVAGDQGRGQEDERHRRDAGEPGLAAGADPPAGAGHGQGDHRLEARGDQEPDGGEQHQPGRAPGALGREHRRGARGQPERPGEGVGQVAGDALPEGPAVADLELAVPPPQGDRVAARLPGQVQQEQGADGPDPQRPPVQRADDPGEGQGRRAAAPGRRWPTRG